MSIGMQKFLNRLKIDNAACNELNPSYIKPVQLQKLEQAWGFEIPPNYIDWDTEKVLYLNLSFTPNLDLTALSNLPDLVGLSLLHSKVTDISVVKHLPKLTYLEVSYSSIYDFSILKNLLLLEDLSVDNTRFNNINLLNSPDLEILNCNNTRIRTLSGIEHFKKLNWLTISNSKINDLSPLQGLPLKYLDISGINANLNPISELSLEFLDISNTDTKVIPCVNPAYLIDLILNFTKIVDISEISKYYNLETFVAVGCDIQDFTPLLELPKLQELTVGKGKLSKKQQAMFDDKNIEINFYEESTYY